MQQPASIELSQRRRYGVLAICCFSLLVVSMDNTILNIALPTIQREFDSSLTALQWTVDSYLLVLASLLLLAGSMADRFGRRRIFQLGLVIFTLGSIACSAAPTIGWLIAARAVQAIGGSMLNPVAMSIITNVFTDPRARARAIGIWGSVFGVSLALGPVVGGILTSSLGWRSVFWINVPIGLAALVLTAFFVPESRAAHPRRIDPIGQLLVITTLGGLIFGIIEGPARGWTAPEIVAAFAVSLLSAIALIIYELHCDEPLIEFGFFKRPSFTGAILIAVVAFSAFAAFLFLNTIYLQTVLLYTPVQAGVCLLPLAVGVMIMAPISGRMVARMGARPSLLISGTCITLSSLILVSLTETTPLAVLLPTYLIFGIGTGMVNAPVTNSAVSGMPRDRAGVAAGFATTSRQIGQALGVAIGGSIIGVAAQRGAAQFTEASHAAWWLVASCGLLIIAICLITTGKWARRIAKQAIPLTGSGS